MLRLASRALFAAFAVSSAFAVMTIAREASADDYRAPEYGWGYGELDTPRTLSMGGAARAFGMSTSSISINPANAVASRVYHFEALFDIDTRAHRLQYGAAVLDAVTSRLAMGVIAAKTDLGNDSDPFKRSAIDVRAAAAYPVSDKLLFGVTGHYIRVTQDGVGVLGQSAVSRSASDDPNFRNITFDAGLALALTDMIRLGLVGYNLTNTGSVLAPLMFGGGLGVRVSDFTLEGNLVGVDKAVWGAWKTRIQVGAEYLAGAHYPLRAGWAYDAGMRRHSISFGAGYVDQTFAIDVGARQEVSVPEDPWGRALVISIGLRYFYETAAPDTAPAATQF